MANKIILTPVEGDPREYAPKKIIQVESLVISTEPKVIGSRVTVLVEKTKKLVFDCKNRVQPLLDAILMAM